MGIITQADTAPFCPKEEFVFERRL